ncbi:protein PPP1R35 homolog [Drosophila virilis]|uniref:Protein phosphatase 1 regulatory subunit 35 C-terminal domain-containing protein n=1 Tax=Drosophila virilis TaxID=7244 RepID=B4M8V9_DROVI|nr:uncharacterized protein LOC6634312 [Drosophila virilis]EDW57635.1 uncharacterized protein Dvir_GJ18030 [Drosophila virilis]
MPHKRKTRFQYNPKQVTRRVQLTSSAPNVCVKPDNGSHPENIMPEQRAVQQRATPQATGNKFAVPQFNTMIRSQAEVATLQKMRVAATGPELTPRSKAAIAPKLTQKMNFPQARTVFRDLIPINVNDSLREIERPRIVKAKDPSKSNIAEPVLADYVEKIEHVQLLMPEPELIMEFPDEEFDFLRAYKKVYRYK